jgi:arylsulfatase A-like enzyme
MHIKFIIYLFILFSITNCGKKKEGNTLTLNKKPNIIVILLDDAGYADFGFMGSKDLETPHIDKLAKNGVIFTDAHVSASVCAPSRAGLITGKYQQRFGFEANHTGDKKSGDIGLSDDVLTMATIFKRNDYKTIALGKWHLGGTKLDHPNKRGFDDFYGFLAGSRSYFPMKNPSTNQMLQYNDERVVFDGYMTDVLGDKSVSYIEEHQNEPYFMYLSYNAVHTPMEAKQVHLKKYKDHPRKELAAMTWSLDENIGKLIDKLKKTKQLDNTLIFFLSDNGGAHTNSSSNGALKGFKGNKFEGGHRVPFLMHWPKQLKGNQKFDGLSSSLDIFSTALAAAGISKDESLSLDGVNLLPYLKGEITGNPHDKLFWRKLNEAAARIGDHKLVRLQDYGSTLYNLKNDLGETSDLTKSDTPTSKNLHKELELWENGLIDPLWDEEEWMDVTFHIQKRLMQNKPILYKTPKARKNYLNKQSQSLK